MIDIFAWKQKLFLWVGSILKDIRVPGFPDDLAPGETIVVGHFEQVEHGFCRLRLCNQFDSLLIYFRVFCGWVNRVN